VDGESGGSGHAQGEVREMVDRGNSPFTHLSPFIDRIEWLVFAFLSVRS